MPVGQAQAPLVIPSTSELAGGSVTPAVTPSAVAQMTDALRQGFLTADDIIQRTGKRAQLKEKADVLALTEAMSPGAVQARQQAQRTALVQSKLGEAQAEAELPLVQPRASLSASDIEEKQAEQTYGVGIPAFKNLSAEAGTSAPVTPEGKPDWAARAKLGIDLISWKQKRDSARERLIPVRWESSDDGSQLLKFNKSGELISLTLEQRLSREAISPFQEIQPGTVQTQTAPVSSAPQELPLVGTPEQITKWRARLINEGVSGVPDMSDVEVDQLIESRRRAQNVQPQASITPSKPVIEPTVGQRTESGFSLGPPKSKDKPVPGEGIEKLAVAGQAIRTAGKLKETYETLITNSPIFTGLIAGSLTKATAGKRWQEQVAAFEREATAILAPVAKGTYNETGVLSDKDVERYKSVIPDLRDNPKIGAEKIRRLLEEATTAYNSKLDVWRQAGYDVSGFENVTVPTSTPTAATTQGKTFEIQGVGKVFRGADGKMYRQ